MLLFFSISVPNTLGRSVDLDRTFLPPSYRRRATVFDAYQRLSTVFVTSEA